MYIKGDSQEPNWSVRAFCSPGGHPIADGVFYVSRRASFDRDSDLWVRNEDGPATVFVCPDHAI